MITDIFNQTKDPLLMRLTPKAPQDLADRIIAAAQSPEKVKSKRQARTRRPDNVGILLFIPRPAMVLSLLFVLSLFAGMQFDMGFNIPEDALMSQQDILFSFDEDNL